MSNSTPPSPHQIVHVLVKAIDTLRNSFAELDGVVRDEPILHEITCLKEAIRIIRRERQRTAVLTTYRRIWERYPRAMRNETEAMMKCWSPIDHANLMRDQELISKESAGVSPGINNQPEQQNAAQ